MKPLRTFLLAVAFIATRLVAAEPIPDSAKVNGFAIGCQAWTFKKFTVFEAIDKTKETGAKVIELFPGQSLSPEEKNVKFGHEAPKEVWEKVAAKAKEAGILPVAYGVVGLSKNEAESRKVFEFAKFMGIRVINTESADAIDTIEKLVKEFDIKVGFHDHPKKPNDPSYRMWDPNYILELVKDRDLRIGACADTGHWVRSNLKPVDCLRILKGRVVSSHLKDLQAPLPSGHDVVYGTGVSDIAGILTELQAQNFDGPLSVEFEYNWDKNVEDAKQCVEFVSKFGTK
jgi:sugar phosphate isomerase/epimerase